MKVYECNCGKYLRVCNGNCEYWCGKKETKMTRQEAIDKIVAKGKWSDVYSGTLVDALEALGLIKFEEDDWKLNFLKIVRKENGGGTEHLIQSLTRHGYTIVRNKP